MLVSFALVFLVGMSFKKICDMIKLPGLIGLIITGIILGPFVLNVLSDDLLNVSDLLREFALIVIIFRAGLSLDLEKLLKNKGSVILLSFLPASFEIAAVIILGPLLLNLSILDSAILGCIVGAVSPAVIVPNMIKIINKGYGNDKGVAQMIMSAASVDDIFVITIFLALINLKTTGAHLDIFIFINILITIVSGIVGGVLIGKLFNKLYRYVNLQKEYVFLLVVSVLLIINSLEPFVSQYFGFSSLLAIMAFGASINIKELLKSPFESTWSIFEILLFVLIGSKLNLEYLFAFGLYPILLIALSLIIRSIGVGVALIRSSLNKKERLFVSMSFLPKATVQAAIGPIPLAMGFASGELMLTVAIVSILITAPLGSFLINMFYKKLLVKSK